MSDIKIATLYLSIFYDSTILIINKEQYIQKMDSRNKKYMLLYLCLSSEIFKNHFFFQNIASVKNLFIKLLTHFL